MSYKIYFCGSIRAGRQDGELYGRLIEQLKGYGTVLTEVVGFKDADKYELVYTDKQVHGMCTDWLQQCDVLVAEVTQPSMGVGYEIGTARALGKNILCLYRPEGESRLSAMIAGADNGTTFRVKKYNEPEAADIFKELFARIGAK